MNPIAPPAPAPSEEALSLAGLLNLLYDGRKLILGTVALALLLAGVYLLWTTRIYAVDALVQVESRKAGKGGEALAAMTSGLFEAATEAQAELEILASSLVLGRTAEKLHLDLVARPRWGTPLDAIWLGRKAGGPALDVETFELPDPLLGKRFLVTAGPGGSFTWEAPDGTHLAKGRVGEQVRARFGDQDLTLLIRALDAKPGRTFILKREPMQVVVDGLRKRLTLMERGKQTNIISLSLEDPNPARGVRILETILEQYIYQNIERKAEEVSRSLAFLEQQLPILRARRSSDEQLINQSRALLGSVDLDKEAEALVAQGAALETEITGLRQKRVVALSSFEEGSPTVVNLDQQIAALAADVKMVEARVKHWPASQQKIMSLKQDAQVNQDLYTALLNNMQQLQISRAGETGNARIVDHAIARVDPVKPLVSLVLLLGVSSGLLVGFGACLLKRALHPGLDDPQALEGQFGLPVLVAVPHSENQASLMHRKQRGLALPGLLATSHPEDLAIESLRSLRTSLHFLLLDAPNKCIMLAGPGPGIGKSFVSANLAAVLGQGGSRVLLVDADLRRGHLHESFPNLSRERGLADILSGDLPWQEALRQAQGVALIPTGTIPPNPAELLLGPRFGAFLRDVEQSFDHVLIDVPPVLAVTDAAIVGSQVGTVLLVLKAGAHTVGEVQTMLRSLETAGVEPKGFIFNDIKHFGHRYGSYNYSYHYKYGKDEP